MQIGYSEDTLRMNAHELNLTMQATFNCVMLAKTMNSFVFKGEV